VSGELTALGSMALSVHAGRLASSSQSAAASGLLRVRFGRVGLRSMSAGLHSEADARPDHAVQLHCWRPIGPDVQCRKGRAPDQKA